MSCGVELPLTMHKRTDRSMNSVVCISAALKIEGSTEPCKDIRAYVRFLRCPHLIEVQCVCVVSPHVEHSAPRPHQDSRLGHKANLSKKRKNSRRHPLPDSRFGQNSWRHSASLHRVCASTVRPALLAISGHLDSPRSRLGMNVCIAWSTHRRPHPSGGTPSSTRFEQHSGRHPQQHSRFGQNSRRHPQLRRKNSTCIVCPRPTLSQ